MASVGYIFFFRRDATLITAQPPSRFRCSGLLKKRPHGWTSSFLDLPSTFLLFFVWVLLAVQACRWEGAGLLGFAHGVPYPLYLRTDASALLLAWCAIKTIVVVVVAVVVVSSPLPFLHLSLLAACTFPSRELDQHQPKRSSLFWFCVFLFCPISAHINYANSNVT